MYPSKETFYVGGTMSIFSGGIYKSCFMEPCGHSQIANLFLDSHAKVSRQQGHITIQKTIEVSPHYFVKCYGDHDYVEAGSGKNSSHMTCPWGNYQPSGIDRQRFNAPNESCLIRQHLCHGATTNGTECNANWLYQLSRPTKPSNCFRGMDGMSIFWNKFNHEQNCTAKTEAAPTMRFL